MDALSKSFPSGVRYDIPYDTTRFIEVSIREVVQTLGEALVLVVLVVYLFLQSWRATLIPMVAVPVSLIGAFAGMYVLGFSINTLTLFGMVLCIGLVVDDAIVVVENVERHIEGGLSPKDAAKKAMEEVAGPVIAIVLVLVSVFIPTAVLGGITGQLYRQFAVTIAISVTISGFVALTLSPALCALVLKPNHRTKRVFFQRFNRFFEWTRHRYTATVGMNIRRAGLALGIYARGCHASLSPDHHDLHGLHSGVTPLVCASGIFANSPDAFPMRAPGPPVVIPSAPAYSAACSQKPSWPSFSPRSFSF